MLQKLGKLAPRYDRRTLRLARYLTDDLPTPPVACGREFKVPNFPLFLNDSLGDCTIAAAGHMIQVWTANVDQPVTPRDNDIISAYSAITGYTPSNPDTDQGAVELDVLNYWRNTGIAGHKIGAFVSLEPKNEDHIRAAIFLLGGCYIGVMLPMCVQDADSWEVPPYGPTGDGEPGSWGGHCLAPGTRILTADLRWVPIENLKVGDRLVGFDENVAPGDRCRRYTTSVVEACPTKNLPCYDLEFVDGTIIRASADHRWLASDGHAIHWLRTDRMRVGQSGTRTTKVLKPLEVWEDDESRDGGYLAAAFDGEGHLGTGGANRGIHQLGFTQKPNAMLFHVREVLEERGYPFSESHRVHGFGHEPCWQLRLSDRANLLRFLGSIRPHRLMGKFVPARIGALSGKRRVSLRRKTAAGVQPVIALQTSTRTYLAEGFASHNCVPVVGYGRRGLTCVSWGKTLTMSWEFWRLFVDESYAVLSEDYLRQGTTPNGFNLSQLQADLEVLKGATQ